MKENGLSDWQFIIVNTVFWLILGGFLLSNEDRLMVGGAILAILIGVFAIHGGVKKSGGLNQADSVLMLSLITGTISVLVGGAILIQSFTSGNLTSVHQRIAQVANHKTTNLDLSGKNLTTLDPDILNLSPLTSLNLENNRLTALPPEIGQLTNLEYLRLGHNQLTELPPEIGYLTNLKVLWLGENQLSDIPPEIGNLDNLESLILSDNQLTSLPAGIGQLSHLNFLSLFRNQLTGLPPEFGQLSSLTILYLDDNQLTELPPELAQLTQLQNLSLNRNPLGELPAGFVEQAQSRGLQIIYTPGAEAPSQVNYVLLYPVVIVVIFIVAFALDRWLDKLEKRLRIGIPEGNVYAIPAFARAACILVVLLISMVDGVLFTASLHPEGTGVTSAAGIGVPLLLAPLVLVCLYLLLKNNGVVVLTEDAIILRRVWREKRLTYKEIVNTKKSNLGLPPTLIVKGARVTLRIPRSAENFPELYQTVMQRITGEYIPTFPFHLSPARMAWFFGVGGVYILIILYLGIGLAGFWLPYFQGQPPDYGFALFLLAAISVFFLPAIFIFIREALNKQQPVEMIFTDETVRFRLPGRPWQTLPVERLSAIELKRVEFPVSVTSFPARIWSESMTYRIILKFDSQQLVIGQDRAKQFGFQPERLHRVFQQLYPGQTGD